MLRCSIHPANVASTVHDKVWHLVNESMHLETSEGMAHAHLSCHRNGFFTFFFLVLFCRLIGLCLLQNELFPLFLQRHVLKYILGRTIRFHDLAFFDPVVYESLRQLVTDSTGNAASVLSDLELNFE